MLWLSTNTEQSCINKIPTRNQQNYQKRYSFALIVRKSGEEKTHNNSIKRQNTDETYFATAYNTLLQFTREWN